MYSCCNLGKNTKTKVIVLSVIGIAIVAASYFVFTSTNNGTALVLSGILGFAACPAMCAVMGGGMWIASRFANRKSQINSEKENTEQSCCPKNSNEHRKKNLNST